MVEPLDPLPTQADDPRLDGWYHTIELAPGVVTRATWDHRSTVDLVGLPKSLAGKTALDVGTADGFWAFELERRGADHVTAIDLPRLGDVDLVPRYRATVSQDVLDSRDWPIRFSTAKKALGSKVDYKNISVYTITPETLGEFDVVYCGSLLLHLMNPLQALIGIRSVCKEYAVIETASFHPDPIESTFPDRPYMWFGRLDWEGNKPGSEVGYWSFTPRALCDMLIYAGFSWVEPLDSFPMKRAGSDATLMVTPVIAHVAPNPSLEGYRKTKAQLANGQRLDPPQGRPRPLGARSILKRILATIDPGK
jgi:tRNA (mo5U34)-methyltransferase